LPAGTILSRIKQSGNRQAGQQDRSVDWRADTRCSCGVTAAKAATFRFGCNAMRE